MNKIKSLFSQLRLTYSTALVIILLACFLFVSFSIKSFGAAVDEPLIYDYAVLDARVYNNLVFAKPYEYMVELYDLPYYGPAYWLAGNILTSPLQAVFPSLDRYDAWHIFNFATFLLGAWCLFCLAKRFTSPRAAFLASLLYLTQPLLWGHGIMNPKDTPFATFFLASVLAGVRMVEEVAKPGSGRGQPLNLLRGRRRRFLTAAGVFVCLLALSDLVFGHFLARPPLEALIGNAYAGPQGSFLHSLFQRLAAQADAVPASSYVNKALQLVNVAEFTLLLLAASGMLIHWLVRASSRSRWILLAGIIAGLAFAMRVVAPAALGLVAIYAFFRLGKRALLPLAACLGVGFVTAFIFWPYLWSDPLGHLWKSVSVMAQFPWLGQARFENSDLVTTDLPWYYLPKLIGIQLTLPLLGLAIAGLGLLIYAGIRRRLDWGLALIPVLWFLIPLAAVVAARPHMYDNFRQFLFILPPLFLLAAVAIDAIIKRLQRIQWQAVFALAILVPGIAAGAWLNPYEYVYYNALMGWTGGIERQFENDYWFTSMCEAARYMNTVAGDGTRIGVTAEIIKTLFLRCADKKFDVVVERLEVSQINADYSIIPTRYDDDIDYFRQMDVIKVIGRGNTLFAVIKKAAP